MSVTYPLDQSGTKATNLVKNEFHAVNEAHFRDYYFIVPNFAPFFVTNFKAKLIVNDVVTDLKEDVDFTFTLSYVTGTRVTGKAMYGGITLHNLNANGLIALEYQTVGGDQIADRLHVLTLLSDKAYNPRTTIWDILTNVPNAFPPTPHYQDYDTFYGQEKLVTALLEVRDAILNNSSLTGDKIEEFLDSINNGVKGYIKKEGGTMTGPLVLTVAPQTRNDAVSKGYVDDNFIDINELSLQLAELVKITTFNQKLAQKLNLTGGTMTGPINLSGTPTEDSHAVTKRYVDQTFTSIQNQLTAMQTTVNEYVKNQITKSYVDDLIHEIKSYVQGFIALK